VASAWPEQHGIAITSHNPVWAECGAIDLGAILSHQSQTDVGRLGRTAASLDDTAVIHLAGDFGLDYIV
jgi:hypothetical protein